MRDYSEAATIDNICSCFVFYHFYSSPLARRPPRHYCYFPLYCVRLQARLSELDTLVSDPKLYDDSARAGKIVKERAKVESKLEAVKGLASELQTWREMHGEMDVRR